MKEIRINKELITHIEIYPAEKTDYIWCDELPSSKALFGLVSYGGYKEGWYDDGKYWKYRLTTEDFEGLVEIDDSIWSLPFLRVFCGNTVVHGKHYENLETIQEICEKYFPHVNIKLL